MQVQQDDEYQTYANYPKHALLTQLGTLLGYLALFTLGIVNGRKQIGIDNLLADQGRIVQIGNPGSHLEC